MKALGSVLTVIGLLALLTTVYTAGMAAKVDHQKLSSGLLGSFVFLLPGALILISVEQTAKRRAAQRAQEQIK